MSLWSKLFRPGQKRTTAVPGSSAKPPSLPHPNARELELFRSSTPQMQAEALVQSAMDNNVARATNLIDNFGCNVNGVTGTGFTALHAAIVKGHEPMAELLLSRGADPNARERDGSPMIFRAAGVGHAWAVRRLLQKGADPNATGANNGTALHVAAAMGKTDIVKLLMDAGANTKSTDSSGNMPGMVALSRGHKQLAAVLGVQPYVPAKVSTPVATVVTMDDIAFELLHHDFAHAQRYSRETLGHELEFAGAGQSDTPDEAHCKAMEFQVRFGGPAGKKVAFEVRFRQGGGLKTAKGVGWDASLEQVNAQYGESHWTLFRTTRKFTLSLASAKGVSVPGVNRRLITFDFPSGPLDSVTYEYISDEVANSVPSEAPKKTDDELKVDQLIVDYTPRYVAAAARMWEAKSDVDRQEARAAMRALFVEMSRLKVGTRVVQSAYPKDHRGGQIFTMYVKKLAATETVARMRVQLPHGLWFPELLDLFQEPQTKG